MRSIYYNINGSSIARNAKGRNSKCTLKRCQQLSSAPIEYYVCICQAYFLRFGLSWTGRIYRPLVFLPCSHDRTMMVPCYGSCWLLCHVGDECSSTTGLPCKGEQCGSMFVGFAAYLSTRVRAISRCSTFFNPPYQCFEFSEHITY